MIETNVVIFDMDGTLYQIDGKKDGYKGSTLEFAVVTNARNFIQEHEECSPDEAEVILRQALQDEVGASRFLSARYGITRREYFDVVWNIPPEGIVQNYEIAVEVVNQLKSLEKRLILLTSAPEVWQTAVIGYLGLVNCFDEVYTQETYNTKDEIFRSLAEIHDPESVVSVGDQLESDIVPAQNVGFQTVHVESPNDISKVLELFT